MIRGAVQRVDDLHGRAASFPPLSFLLLCHSARSLEALEKARTRNLASGLGSHDLASVHPASGRDARPRLPDRGVRGGPLFPRQHTFSQMGLRNHSCEINLFVLLDHKTQRSMQEHDAVEQL